MEDEPRKGGAPPATVTKLRDAMPSRRTPGKSSARDPAAAPFDTDDEAAGRSPTREAIARAMAEEVPLGRRTFPKDEEKKMPSATVRVVVVGVVLLVASTFILLFYSLF